MVAGITDDWAAWSEYEIINQSTMSYETKDTEMALSDGMACGGDIWKYLQTSSESRKLGRRFPAVLIMSPAYKGKI
jgi:hypothetical protein